MVSMLLHSYELLIAFLLDICIMLITSWHWTDPKDFYVWPRAGLGLVLETPREVWAGAMRNALNIFLWQLQNWWNRIIYVCFAE